MTETTNIHGTDEGNLTLVLPQLAKDLARLRPGHPAGHHISNLIGQLKSYEGNPDGVRPRILASIDRIQATQGK